MKHPQDLKITTDRSRASAAIRSQTDELLAEAAALVGEVLQLVRRLEAETEAEWREGDL